MDALMIVLRIIHIFSGIFWVGAAMFMLGFVTPTAQALGPDGGKFMQGLLRFTPFDKAMPAASILTTLSGVWMYWKVSDGFDSDWMSSTPGIVLSIGVVAGILAFGHGGATLGSRTQKMKTLAEEIAAGGGPPSPEQAAQAQELQAEIGLHSKVSFGIMVVAVLGMASARYF